MTNDKNNEYLEPFRLAIKLEEEGRNFFLEAAKETNSDLARQTFEFLAKEEDQHVKQIKKFYTALQETESVDLPDMGESNAESRLESFQLKLENLKDEFKATESDMEAYKLALKFENGAEEFYAEMMDKSKNPQVRKFYAWLIAEESMHSRLINSCLKFVDDPVDWFKKRQR